MVISRTGDMVYKISLCVGRAFASLSSYIQLVILVGYSIITVRVRVSIQRFVCRWVILKGNVIGGIRMQALSLTLRILSTQFYHLARIYQIV